MWCATKLATDAGGWRQINRAGHPMMWPIFWPNDTDFTNPANTRHPSEDVGAGGQVHRRADRRRGGGQRGPPPTPKATARPWPASLFPDVLPYVIGTPRPTASPAFNGRAQADNAPEAMLSLVTNTAIPAGLTPAVARAQRAATFPYVVPA